MPRVASQPTTLVHVHLTSFCSCTYLELCPHLDCPFPCFPPKYKPLYFSAPHRSAAIIPFPPDCLYSLQQSDRSLVSYCQEIPVAVSPLESEPGFIDLSFQLCEVVDVTAVRVQETCQCLWASLTHLNPFILLVVKVVKHLHCLKGCCCDCTEFDLKCCPLVNMLTSLWSEMGIISSYLLL